MQYADYRDDFEKNCLELAKLIHVRPAEADRLVTQYDQIDAELTGGLASVHLPEGYASGAHRTYQDLFLEDAVEVESLLEKARAGTISVAEVKLGKYMLAGRHWYLRTQGNSFVRTVDGYKAAHSGEALSNACLGLISKEKGAGDVRPTETFELVKHYGHTARFDGERLLLPVGRTDWPAKYDADTAAWLDALFPTPRDQARLAAYLRRAWDCDLPCAALVLHGAAYAGKSRFAAVMARYLGTSESTPADGHVCFGSYGDGLQNSPVVVFEEEGKCITAETFKKEVTGRDRLINVKSEAKVRVVGCLRLVFVTNIPANTLGVICQGQSTQAAREGVLRRLFVHEIPDAAKGFFSSDVAREQRMGLPSGFVASVQHFRYIALNAKDVATCSTGLGVHTSAEELAELTALVSRCVVQASPKVERLFATIAEELERIHKNPQDTKTPDETWLVPAMAGWKGLKGSTSLADPQPLPEGTVMVSVGGLLAKLEAKAKDATKLSVVEVAAAVVEPGWTSKMYKLPTLKRAARLSPLNLADLRTWWANAEREVELEDALVSLRDAWAGRTD